MSTKYMFIDDQQTTATGIALGLSINDLKVDFLPAKPWNEQIEEIKQRRSEYQGLLLDLQLRFPTNTMKYNAPALAQEIRNLVKEKDFDDFPILLCSTDENISNSFDKNTNSDLFDEIYHKNNFGDNVELEFIDLAKGYERIREIGDNFSELLQNKNHNIIQLILDKVKETDTPHSIASFILNQLILTSGLLVDENLLAIRLGIDKEKSGNWEKVKESLENFKYKGIFSEAWQRWWIGDIMRWWRTISNKTSLQSMNAEQRVELLRENLELDSLTSIQLPENHEESTFWYQCKFSDIPIPLDSYDGFLLKGQDSKLEWQDKDYISKNYVCKIESSRDKKDILEKISYSQVKKVKAIFNQQ